MTALDDLPVTVARHGARIDEHDRRFTDVHRDLGEATKAIWGAVEALRARPQVHPVATTIIAVLTAAIGALAGFIIRGG